MILVLTSSKSKTCLVSIHIKRGFPLIKRNPVKWEIFFRHQMLNRDFIFQISLNSNLFNDQVITSREGFHSIKYICAYFVRNDNRASTLLSFEVDKFDEVAGS